MGEIVRYKRDVWGEEVILGVSWDLLWVIAVAVLVLLAAHAIVMAALAKKNLDRPTAEGRRVVRHESIDRAFHWLMVASIFVLIFTGTAPIIGLRIAWLNIHWISGLILTFLIVAHIIRSMFWQDFKSMLLTPKDFTEPFDSTSKPGKYYFEQKGLHWAATVVVLAVIVSPMKTGLGKSIFSKPRLPIVVPRVVSETERPTISDSVNMLLTRIWPNCVVSANSASR